MMEMKGRRQGGVDDAIVIEGCHLQNTNFERLRTSVLVIVGTAILVQTAQPGKTGKQTPF